MLGLESWEEGREVREREGRNAGTEQGEKEYTSLARSAQSARLAASSTACQRPLCSLCYNERALARTYLHPWLIPATLLSSAALHHVCGRSAVSAAAPRPQAHTAAAGQRRRDTRCWHGNRSHLYTGACASAPVTLIFTARF